jgi:hypothetical membrane protein
MAWLYRVPPMLSTRRPPRRRGEAMKKTEFGALLWALCWQYFVAEAISIAGWPGRYSLRANFISDLGAVRCHLSRDPAANLCSPLHALMNASFLLQGFLIVAGALLVRPLLPRGGLWTIALLLVGASGLGVFLVGLAPEDVAPGPHYSGAAENFLCCNSGMAIIGVAMLRWRREARVMGLIASAAGLTGLLGLALLAMHIDPGLGVGAIERVTAYPFTIWIGAIGMLLLRRGALLKGAS